uniref:G-protein coupled receptors family 3 profile domain-containing protein n=1 Tax=Mucochytrium quahogii TaxID=96639 RepID=A0A7S2S4F2_9STRA|mmetsp:Transcript_24310/g.52701  ORF Transcript_24310/g.52701 Transcript_24310/m.52701 type:complete len:320 (+) Transcript_24310:211-1170(+)
MPSQTGSPLIDSYVQANMYMRYTVDSLCIVLALGALVIMAMYWNRPVMVVSQRMFMLMIIVTSLVANTIALPEVATGDWQCEIVYIASMVAFISLVIAKEYRAYQLYKAISSQTVRTVGYVFPCLFVVVCVAATTILFVICRRGHTSQFGDSYLASQYSQREVGNVPRFFFTGVLIIGLFVARIARKVPRICGDSKVTFALSFIGLIYVAVAVAETYTGDLELNVQLQIVGLFLHMLMHVGTLISLLYARLLSMNMTKAEVIRELVLHNGDVMNQDALQETTDVSTIKTQGRSDPDEWMRNYSSGFGLSSYDETAIHTV